MRLRSIGVRCLVQLGKRRSSGCRAALNAAEQTHVQMTQRQPHCASLTSAKLFVPRVPVSIHALHPRAPRRLQFDLVSAVDELNKQIRLEFDFTR